MEHVSIFTLVVITLLQLCRAQSSNSTPEWYAANDINDTSYTPRPITELFSTETSFSPEDPIIVLSPSSSLPSNRGIVSSPTPITLYSDDTDSQPPPSVIPLSSTELPSSSPQPIPISQTTPIDTQPERLSTTAQGTSVPENTSRIPEGRVLPNQAPAQVPRTNVPPRVIQNPPIINRLPPQQPRNIQFVLPTPSGNRFFQGQQLAPNGQPNVFLLYEQPPQIMRSMPPATIPLLPQSNVIAPQPAVPVRASQQINARPNTMRQPPQAPNQLLQPNPIPPTNIPSPNVIIFPQPNQQQTSQTPINQVPINNQLINNPASNQASANQMPIIQQQPVIQGTVVRQRPNRQRNRNNRINNRRVNRVQTPNGIPCQAVNNTAVPAPPATNTPSPVVTIRLIPSTRSRNNVQINSRPNTNRTTTARPRQNNQANERNYERCLNSCRDRRDRICAAPQRDVQINPDTLKGFPSMCHMACHNAFRGNPIYERVANGRCGKLRTRVQTVDNTKIRRDELKNSQYTIISNIPGTVVELAP